ncbi:hypothetical protein RJ641_003050 [Dillenia turbinata]|uniref:Uncharacterized protein n=1 Tax=Dillenia turbinata TaxID=194707 RepID=A0AAN8VPX9_9MAGN
MTTVPNLKTLLYHHITTTKRQPHHLTPPQATISGEQTPSNGRRKALTTLLTTSLALVGLQATPIALAEKWGVRSFNMERDFEHGLSPEDAVARIKQTPEGMHSMRYVGHYVLKLDYYVRIPKAYESYVFYEKTLKSSDDLVALLA